MSRAVGQTKQNLLTEGKNVFNFRLARDQVVLLETAANLCANRLPANNIYAVFIHDQKTRGFFV